MKAKFEALKHKCLGKLTADYESKFEKIYQFQVIDVLKFLKWFKDNFEYEDIKYEELPICYEVLQSASKSYVISNQYYDVDIYGYYIESYEIKSLKQKVIEFVDDYNMRINKDEVTKLYNITILPKILLERIFSLSKG